MASYYFPRFSEVELLKQLHLPLLFQLLQPYRDYLCSKYDIHLTNNPAKFPYQQLVGALALPDPSPTPNPDPTPKPNPPPTVTLKDWVSQNVPDTGKSKAAALASCYESAALGIENDSIRSQEAAFSVIRTASQTKIDVSVWSGFLDALADKITEKLAGNNDVKTLGTIFNEIAEGLKSVSGTETQAEPEVSAPDIIPFPATSQSSTCPDSTGKACQPQHKIQYRRAR